MKKNRITLISIIATLFLLSCNKEDQQQSIILPTHIEMVYPSSSASYKTIDISYNSDFTIQKIIKNLSGDSKINYDCTYNELQLLSNLKITEIPSGEERNYTIEYTNGIVSKITETTFDSTTNYNIDHNNNTNTYKYNFPYTWKFNAANDLEYYHFSSTTLFEITYDDGAAFNYFMKPQPILALLDTYFAENFFQDLYFLSSKPILKTRYEDFVSSDIIEHNYINTFNTTNKIIKSEISLNSATEPFLIKTISYQEINY
ncbi:conserved hypothetical protein [Flavobacterium sp. 9AF]|uniref:hypothetical protein n=1 Tax=Flavobacterium sp. 9AF TaxID=2653142 RepID=UPI0012F111ED|nr:hypothetical protein [Flavobacterium sp. 9AF]VXB70258.1 conserved hypothetical protein [Flavobacterium sp. 9AF]